MPAPALTGFTPSITFDENLVNATPQLLDADVVFTDSDDDFDGGFLTLSGLLAEDRVSVRNQGSGAGQIGLSGANVTFGGVVIGTLAGGSGATLTITFNAAATSAAIDALIQNLTYANVSDTPTATRNLLLNITDAAGNDLGAAGAPSFTARTGAANPFNGVDVGDDSAPTFADLDGDGDLDAVIGYDDGLRYYENTGSTLAPVFAQRTGAANPFPASPFFTEFTPTLGDLDGDGDLDLLVGERPGVLHYFENTGTSSAPVFIQRGGASHPLIGINFGLSSSPAFADLDGDGDLDAVIGENDGVLNYFENTGTAAAAVFTVRTGAANPFNGVDVGARSTPAFVDLDGDGDLDAVIGENDGVLNYFENIGTAAVPVFTQRTGGANPFNGVDVGSQSTPAFADLDGDGDLDAVVGERDGVLNYFENTTVRGRQITITVIAENDAPSATGLPTDVTVVEDAASDLDLSAVTLADVDTAGSLTVTLTASAGTMTAGSGGGVTVTNSGTGVLTLAGTASAIDAFLNTASAIQYTGALNASGDDAATVTVTADDGSGAVTLGVVNVDITAIDDPMGLSGFSATATFAENTVNAAPELLDADVIFTDIDSDFGGGTLTLSGLLAEDRASVRNEGSGAGQIGLSGANVSYGGVVIGTLAGGAGTTLTITFNAAATSEAIDALIQNLTYANVSDTPTASRDLVLNVTDAAGNDLGGPTAFTERTGAANPFNGVDVGNHSTLAFADLDGDGDLDAVGGDRAGFLQYFENTGTAAAPVFTRSFGAATPFEGVNIGHNSSSPAFADVDGDGDLDAVIGDSPGILNYFENTGTAAVPVFTQRINAANPFNDIDVGGRSSPTFADLDGDGDLDAVIGEYDGTLNYFENTGTAGAPIFTQRTGATNPFNGVDVGNNSSPAFVDLDADGDLDALIGEYDGVLNYFENTGTAAAPLFTQRSGAANPFNGVDVGFDGRPAVADLDGDGDLDAVIGEYFGTLNYFENTTARGQTITVSVTADNDAPSATGLPTDVTVTEDLASDLDLSAIVLIDPDTVGDITVVLTGSAGTMTASSGGGVTVTDSGTGAITLTGTAAAIDAFLNTASAIQYTGALNASGDDAATVTITADDGSGAVELGVVNIDITDVIDPPALTGFGPSITFAENTVNATPQLLDAGVVFSDSDFDYDGGFLTLSGLLAEDRVSVRNEGSGAGQIGLSGADITFGGVVIGALAGGSGATLAITFNAAATSEAIDALIQNLTYANASDTPTASRDLVLNITDAAGNDVGLELGFTQRVGAANPFESVDIGHSSTATFADLDGDGDLDVVVGERDGVLNYFENTGSDEAPVFTARTGAANPFNGVDVGLFSTPAFADLDGDGDLDTVVGERYGTLAYFENTGSTGAPVFTQRTGAANPLNGFDVGDFSAPSFADLDGDGDLDAVVGENDGILNYFENTGTALAPVFTERTGATNPFDGVDVGFRSAPAFADFDGDGELDAMVGEHDGVLNYFENTGTNSTAVFTQRTGGANPFNGVDVGSNSTPAIADLDGDGDLDVLVGELYGRILHFENTSLRDQTITVTVTMENDTPEAIGLPTDMTVTEDVTSDLDLSAVTLSDADVTDTLTVVLTASAGTLTAGSGGGVTVTNSGTGVLTLTGTASAIDAFLNTVSSIQYTGALDASGDNAATVTVTANDGSGAVTLGVVNVDITDVLDTLTGTANSNSLSGGEGNDLIRGLAGNDLLEGNGGDDVLNGGDGDDRLEGGEGIDTADYSDAAAGVTVNLAITGRGQNTVGSGRDGLSGIENLTGSAFGDNLTGDAGDNVLSDTLGGNDRFIGGAGNDSLSSERSGGGAATTVTLTGGIGDDVLSFDGNGRYTDSVTFRGQDGNDVISALGAFRAIVSGGAGNDTVTVDTLGGSFVVRLGSGSDTLVLADTDGSFVGSTANLVRDFVAGAGGDIVDLTAYLAGGALTNYTPGDNPFLVGHMRLVQAGEDTLVQVDRNGGGDGFVTLLTLQKTQAANFTAFNFNGLAPLPDPVEGGAGPDSLTGTADIDVLNGNGGDDILTGGAGNDVLNGGSGNDVLDGGDGDDVLIGGSGGQGDTAAYATASAGVTVNLGISGSQNTGGSGFDTLTEIEHLIGSAFTDALRGDGQNNRLIDTLGGDDFLRGEGGDDALLITRSGGGAATTVRLNGGDGVDSLTFTGNGRFTDTVTMEGEAGNDVITVSGALTIGIDAGAGDDTVIYDTLGGVHRMTLGTGVDTVRLAGTGGLFQASGDNLVRDFTTGAGGDIVDLSAYLAGGALTNYTGGDNPFGDGHMRLIQSGSRTLLQVDRDGGGDGYQTVLAFANTTVAAFTTANFNGFDPTGAAPMPVQAGDKDADAGPQVWVQEIHDKTLMPEVLPGAGDQGQGVFGDVGPLIGVFGGGSDPRAPLTVDEAGDGFLTVTGGLHSDEAEPLVLPGEQADDLPELADPFTWTQADGSGPSALTVAEDGSLLAGSGAGDHGRDGWLF